MDLGSEGLVIGELDRLGSRWVRKCSRSSSLPVGKPLADRRRSSHLEPDFPVEIEQSIAQIVATGTAERRQRREGEAHSQLREECYCARGCAIRLTARLPDLRHVDDPEDHLLVLDLFQWSRFDVTGLQ